MATLTLTLSDLCAAGNHFTLTATGDVSASAQYSVDRFDDPITDEEKATFMRLLVRFAKIGRTAAQVRNALTAGATVTL